MKWSVFYFFLFKQATAEVSNLILQRDCLTLYESSMHQLLNNSQPYFDSSELEASHQQAENESISKVRNLTDLYIICSILWIFTHFSKPMNPVWKPTEIWRRGIYFKVQATNRNVDRAEVSIYRAGKWRSKNVCYEQQLLWENQRRAEIRIPTKYVQCNWERKFWQITANT